MPHRDVLEALNAQQPIKDKLVIAHDSIRKQFHFIERIAVAIYDPETSVLKTYLHSSEDENPLVNYQALLQDAPSLRDILDKGLPRVINNMVTFDDGEHEHTRRIGRSGYAASYTMPMFDDGAFFGFIFFNSTEKDVFDEKVLAQLDLYGHLISLMLINEFSVIKTLANAVKATGSITHYRDPETGSHLDRMSRYSLLIAHNLAESHELDDAYLQHLFMFAPLHDIGKIAIPDNILLKPGPLEGEEMKIMQSHATKGREMIDGIISNFSLGQSEYIDLLRNIATYHHEMMNGSGYPEGKKGDEIPIEARIVAVADIFDALTSERSYKPAWSNEKAMALLKEMAGEKLDKDCVQALINNLEQIIEIQEQFADRKL
ncbi:HD-GYP domain-containing protein [Thiohalophilus sp.]|uniref:HD-GYP domain-containing protein n=1 Tax=Thiohalophilus sp. TaxID=3028392 RepID=UPI002ACEAF1A|nr:HD domain-containing phosphohydrolase [Thiohalophilus sp.]MDZ7802966.1 HD domain-containing protein [Thiohalophilus sp.]